MCVWEGMMHSQVVDLRVGGGEGDEQKGAPGHCPPKALQNLEPALELEVMTDGVMWFFSWR